METFLSLIHWLYLIFFFLWITPSDFYQKLLLWKTRPSRNSITFSACSQRESQRPLPRGRSAAAPGRVRGQLHRPQPHLPAAAAAPAAALRLHEVILLPGPDHHIPCQSRGEKDLSRQRVWAPGNCARRPLPLRVLGFFSINAITQEALPDCGPREKDQRNFSA